jgi:HlyD family secretion protein
VRRRGEVLYEAAREAGRRCGGGIGRRRRHWFSLRRLAAAALLGAAAAAGCARHGGGSGAVAGGITGTGVPGAAAAARLADIDGVPVTAVVRRDYVRTVPAEGNLHAVHSTAVSVPVVGRGGGQLMKIGWLAPDGSRVHAGEVVLRFDTTDIEQALADAAGDMATARTKMEKERSGDQAVLASLERDAAVAERELAVARQFLKKDATVFSHHDILKSEIDQVLAGEKQRLAHAEEATSVEQQRAGMALLDVDLRKAATKMDQARAALAAIAVSAPHDGVLVLRHDGLGGQPHVGDTAWPGQVLAEIPDLSVLQADVYVLEADAFGLAAGLPATVEVESDPGRELAAQVTRVASVPKPRLRGSPVQYFEVTLRFAGAAPPTLKPGERVRAVLRVAERRGALLVPRQSIVERDGRQVVFRWRPGAGWSAAPVVLGPADAATAVVVAGLGAGDVVALRDPNLPVGAAASPPAAAGSAPAAAAPPAPALHVP